MKDKYNQDIDELMNAVVDGEATQRQQTELKRLMLHDPSLTERLESMSRQKRLLNALPVEAAPAELAQEIRASLERRLILDGFTSTQHYAPAARFRRLAAAAAMLLLPLGLLALVVFQIVKPPLMEYEPTAHVVERNSTSVPADNLVATGEQLPFNGVLTFTTGQVAAVSSFVEKMIFDQGLMNAAMPTRTADLTAYQVKTSPQQMLALVDSINEAWTRSTEITLSVVVDNAAEPIEIPQVKAEQLKTLAAESSKTMFARLAARYASANRNSETFYANKTPVDELGSNGYPPLNRPIMTGRYSPQSTQTDAPAIELRIVIQRPAR